MSYSVQTTALVQFIVAKERFSSALLSVLGERGSPNLLRRGMQNLLLSIELANREMAKSVFSNLDRQLA